MPVPWNEHEQYLQYLRNISLVSADCRLFPHEEEAFLHEMDQKDPEVINRLSVLRCMEKSETNLPVSCPSAVIQSFDVVIDDTCLNSTGTAIAAGSLSLASYAPPADGYGTGSLRFLNKLVDNDQMSLTGLSVSGLLGASTAYCGFILCYELFTGHLRMKILEGDCPKFLGCMLLRALPLNETMQSGLLCSILRVIMLNPDVADTLPGYYTELMKSKEAFEKSSGSSSGFFGPVQGFLKGSFDAAKQNASFLQNVCKMLVDANSLKPLKRPNYDVKPYTPLRTIKFVFADAESLHPTVYRMLFGLAIPKPADNLCSIGEFKAVDGVGQLKFDQETVLALSTLPLKVIGLAQYIKDIRACQAMAELDSNGRTVEEMAGTFFEKFNIKNSPLCQSHNAKAVVDRLASDLDLSSRMEERRIPNELQGFSPDDIQAMVKDPRLADSALDKLVRLSQSLQALHRADSERAQFCIDEILTSMKTANGESSQDAVFSLAHQGGLAPNCSFESFASMLLYQNFKDRVAEINPFVASSNLESLKSILVGALLSFSRAGLIARGLANICEIVELLNKLKVVSESGRTSLSNAVSLKSGALAELLATRRGYTSIDTEGRAAYDPRFLLFEFTSNIILHDAQIALVNRFVQAFNSRDDGSLCHQLIMGAGKTTVIAPLLALILGRTDRLVVQVSRICIKS